jgi:DNA repair protein RadC
MKNSKIWQVSEVKLTYQNKVKASDRPGIKSSNDAAQLFLENWSDEIELCEEFLVLFLNRANRVTGIFRLSKGGVAGTVVDIKILFAAALKAMASGVILAHNHPSGNKYPSQADITLTTRIKQAGDILDIKVLDHLILTHDGDYYSFCDEGQI